MRISYGVSQRRRWRNRPTQSLGIRATSRTTATPGHARNPDSGAQPAVSFVPCPSERQIAAGCERP